MQLAENTVVAGRFRLKRLIGKGGMGTVWEATHLRLDIPCAVKFMDLATLKEAHTRFEREAKAAAQLRSPNVVQILDHGVAEDGTPYIAMELLDGEDLGKRLTRLGRMAPGELVPIIGQVCRALTRAHQLGIVHRDLKPDNIFLVRDDDREIAKVLDFGIAKSKANDLASGSSTKTGAMLGTPFYMSPEQAQGTKQIDSRSDLWAMAIICYEALTGTRPFVSEALGDLLIQIIVAPLPVPSQHGPVPLGFDEWWIRAASRDPAHRFQTAKEFADSLALVCGISQSTNVADHARPGSTTQQITPMPYEPRNSTPAPALTPGLPGTGSPVARSYPSLPPKPPNKTGVLVGGIAGAVVLLAIVVVGALALRSKGTETTSGAPSATTNAAATVLATGSGTSALPSSSAPEAVTLSPPPDTVPSASAASSAVAAAASSGKAPIQVPTIAPAHPTATVGVPSATAHPPGLTPRPKPTYNPGI